MSHRTHQRRFAAPFIAAVMAVLATITTLTVPATIAVAGPAASGSYGLAHMTALDELPYLNLQERTGHLSSVAPDRTNSDIDNYLYTDSDGGRVIFDEQGPGVIYRLHLTLGPDASAGNTYVKVYLDGSPTPQINSSIADLASGDNAPFLAPLVEDRIVGSGGYTYYLPIPYAKSARVSLTGTGGIFWQTDWHSFPAGTPIQTWTGNEDSSQARQLWSHAGDYPDPQPSDVTLSGSTTLPVPGTPAVLADLTGPREITAIKLKIPGIDTTRGSSAKVLDDIHVQIYWDHEHTPSVDAPLGSLFGMGYFGAAPARATMMGMLQDGTMYLYFPMPFQHHAHIELVNNMPGSTVPQTPGVRYSIIHRPFTGSFADVGYLRTQWTPQTIQSYSTTPVNWLDVDGAGKVVGIVASRKAVSRPDLPFGTLSFLEGNVHMFADGNKTPSWRDNGTEDTFDGGWYWDQGPVSNPNAGATIKTGDSVAAYRVFVGDAIPFRNHISIDDEPGVAWDPNYAVAYPLVFYYSQKSRMARTDGFAVGDAAAAAAHDYQVTGQTQQTSLDSSFDSYLAPEQVTGQVNAHKGSSRFTLAIDPANEGVVLRRRYDQAVGRQAADVYVDGTLVGRWYQAYANNIHRWAEDDFTLPASSTAGKTSIDVQVRWVPGSPDWTEAAYSAFPIAATPADGQFHVTQPAGTVFASLDTPGTLYNGVPGQLTATIINSTNAPLPRARFVVSAPQGWHIVADPAMPNVIAAHQQLQARWQVTVPPGTPTGTSRLGLRLDYATATGTASASSIPVDATTTPQIKITSFSAVPNTAQPGQQTTFHVTVRDIGPNALSGQVTVGGPNGWTITPADATYDLQPGRSTSVTATTTNPGTSSSRPITFTADTTYSNGQSGDHATTELFTGHLRCLLGNADQPVWHSDPGYGCTLDQGFAFYDPTHAIWSASAPANYCWCQNPGAPLLFHLTVPAGASGRLQLFLVDGDNNWGGRIETVSVEGRTLGTFSNFQNGTWVSADISAADTADGRIDVRVDDARTIANVVVSQASF